jgi:hypothetical protein
LSSHDLGSIERGAVSGTGLRVSPCELIAQPQLPKSSRSGSRIVSMRRAINEVCARSSSRLKQ